MTYNSLTDVGVVATFLIKNYKFRQNVLSKQLEIHVLSDNSIINANGNSEETFQICTKRIHNSIMLNVRQALSGDVKSPKAIAEELLESDFVPEYDPIADYLKGLEKWDGKMDYISDIFRRIPGITDIQVEWYHRWFLSAVAHWLKIDKVHGNDGVPVLIGHQGCGKSTFWQRILPEELQRYFMDHVNLSNKFDKYMALTNNLIDNLDEFDKYTAAQQADIKQLTSVVNVNIRPIYGKTQDFSHRYASFVATTNNPHPLQDPTGSRRFLCVMVEPGKKIDNISHINYTQLYAQAVHEVMNEHRSYWFSDEEVEDIQMANAKYTKILDIDDIIGECFRKPEVNETTSPLSIKEICNIIHAQFPASNAYKNKVEIGRKLTKMGYEKKSRNTGPVYYAIPA